MNTELIITHITEDLELAGKSIANTIGLFDEGATIPFIARYRKERTGGLDEVAINQIFLKYEYYTELEKRKETILKTIAEQGKLTPELEKEIVYCKDKNYLEDLYLPYKPKKRTRATIAREKGLEPLADIMQDPETRSGKKEELLSRFVDPEKNVADQGEALAGAIDIIAERISEQAELRQWMRGYVSRQGVIEVKPKKEWKEKKTKYDMYYEFSGILHKEPSHRVLAIQRGVKEGVLSSKVTVAEEKPLAYLESHVVPAGSPLFADELRAACHESFDRLIYPSVENETFHHKIEEAEQEAINVFGKNLEHILLAPPAGSKRIMGIDPGFRTGCKVAIIDEQGDFKEYSPIFPHEPQKKKQEAQAIVLRMIETHKIELIAIGNGTASKETDMFIRELIRQEGLSVVPVVVSEAGASVYSASKRALQEFPDLDVTVRGAISIARRLQDPLAELVKIDPKSIGVGQYQHDVNQKELKKALDMTVSSSVNRVGVELNTASEDLLSYISGVGAQLAKNIVAYRTKQGAFKDRSELRKVPKLGDRIFELCAGFMRIAHGNNPLDNSAIHPESYPIVSRMAEKLGVDVTSLIGNTALLAKIRIEEYETDQAGRLTLQDIVSELKKPSRDPRSMFTQFTFHDTINTIEDLTIDMELDGIVTNVTNFGAFVDIGVHQDGLVHISKLSDSFIKDPHEYIAVGDRVTVRVLAVDLDLKRISLQCMQKHTIQ